MALAGSYWPERGRHRHAGPDDRLLGETGEFPHVHGRGPVQVHREPEHRVTETGAADLGVLAEIIPVDRPPGVRHEGGDVRRPPEEIDGTEVADGQVLDFRLGVLDRQRRVEIHVAGGPRERDDGEIHPHGRDGVGTGLQLLADRGASGHQEDRRGEDQAGFRDRQELGKSAADASFTFPANSLASMNPADCITRRRLLATDPWMDRQVDRKPGILSEGSSDRIEGGAAVAGVDFSRRSSYSSPSPESCLEPVLQPGEEKTDVRIPPPRIVRHPAGSGGDRPALLRPGLQLRRIGAAGPGRRRPRRAAPLAARRGDLRRRHRPAGPAVRLPHRLRDGGGPAHRPPPPGRPGDPRPLLPRHGGHLPPLPAALRRAGLPAAVRDGFQPAQSAGGPAPAARRDLRPHGRGDRPHRP